MKNLILLLIAFPLTFSSFADTGTLEAIEVDTDLVGIRFENNDKSLVLTFSDHNLSSMHTIIDINRINDLEYKTRVMRYFGGLLKNDSYNFETLIVVIDGKRMSYDWSRENVSLVVKKMCQKAELMI